MSENNNFISLPEYVSENDRDEAYYFIKMLLASLAIKSDTKTGVIDGFKVILTYNKTKLKRESDFKINYNNKLYSLKFLHSKLHHYSDLETNFLVSFVLNHKKQIEDFII